MPYIHEHAEWPNLKWDEKKLSQLLSDTRFLQGTLAGKMQAIGFSEKNEANLQTLTSDIIKSSEIEGEKLNLGSVRSSVARRLGIDIAGASPSDHNVEGIVEMMLDATQKYSEPLTIERLFSWHAALFPTGRSGMYKINVGSFRDDKKGPMQVISGNIGREKIHFEAPAAEKLRDEMSVFVDWYNTQKIDPLIKAAVAHIWFLTIHPFDDGNGRMARALTDLLLARSENSSQRFYSLSSQIYTERESYYHNLEESQKGGTDITTWIIWFLNCLSKAIGNSEHALANVLSKSQFWQTHAKLNFNERQKKILTLLQENFNGNLTSSKWAKLGKCSQDTAGRDIEDLIKKNILLKKGDGRSTHYVFSNY